MQPGVDRGITPKAMGRLQGLHEGFLDQVLGFGFVAAQQTGRSQQPVSMRTNQRLKKNQGRGIPGNGTALNFTILHCATNGQK